MPTYSEALGRVISDEEYERRNTTDNWFDQNDDGPSSGQEASTEIAGRLNPDYKPPQNATRNEWGYWVLPNGNLAPGQQTPGSQGWTPVDAKWNERYDPETGQRRGVPPPHGPNTQSVADYLRSQGVSEHVIADEARNYTDLSQISADNLSRYKLRSSGSTSDRQFDSQSGYYNNDGSLNTAGQAALAARSAPPVAAGRAAPSGSASGPRSLGSFGTGGYPGIAGGDFMTTAPTTSTTLGGAYQYQPFTEPFVAPQAPADLMTPWGRTFQAPTAPTDLMDPWGREYVRPTAADLLSDPGYLARLDAQQRGMERSAAARGTLLTGGHQRSLAEYGQELGSNEYQRLADRALNEYLSAFNVFTTDKTRRGAEFGNTFNRALAGYETDFNVDQADKARRGAEFGNTYNRALGEFGQRFNINQANQGNAFMMGRAGRLDDFNIMDRNRQFGFDVDTNLWNRGRTTKMDDFGILDTNRRFGFDVDKDLWNRNRTGYIDDFNIYRTLDRDYQDDQRYLADWGRQP